MAMEWVYEKERISSTGEHGELIAEATFHERADGVFNIDHTYVAPHLRGRGIADDMMAAVAGHIRERKGKVTASCSYANAWLKRHQKEYQDIISKGLADEALACRLPR